jgi:tetratricopeptide (TPR) repeat protein
MPLQHFFEEQIRSLRIFVNTPGPPRMRVVLVNADTKPVTHRLLAGVESDEKVTAVFVPSDTPFHDLASFFAGLYADLVQAYRLFADVLIAEYILPPPDWQSLKFSSPAERFVRGVSQFANALPEEVGTVTFLLDPAEVTHPGGYRQALGFLADAGSTSEWVKYVVLDDRRTGYTAELLKERLDIHAQSMDLSPEEMETRIDRSLANGLGISLKERRIYTGLLASFAAARKEFDRALHLQQQQLDLTQQQEATPSDLAAVHYNTGNIHLAKKDYTAAVQSYTTALNQAMAAGLSALTPVILTNLGVALFHGEARDEAEHCFDTARIYAIRLNQPPTEAHVLDCRARCHLAAGRLDQAECCWKEALVAYEGITAEPLRFAREGGRRQVLAQLEYLYETTRQYDKLAAIRAEVARGNTT